jgi:hypothetical protein
VHVYYDSFDRVDGVEVFSPSRLIYRGLDLLGVGLDDLQASLRANGVEYVQDDVGLMLEGGRLALFVPAKGDERNPPVKAVYVEMTG